MLSSAHISTESWISWEFQVLDMKFYESRCQVTSLVTPDASASFPRVLGHFQEHWFLMISDGFRVFSCEESGSHPLSLCKRECHKLISSVKTIATQMTTAVSNVSEVADSISVLDYFLIRPFMTGQKQFWSSFGVIFVWECWNLYEIEGIKWWE